MAKWSILNVEKTLFISISSENVRSSRETSTYLEANTSPHDKTTMLLYVSRHEIEVK